MAPFAPSMPVPMPDLHPQLVATLVPGRTSGDTTGHREDDVGLL